MRKLATIVLLLVVFGLPAVAQVLNAGFENWTNGNPTGWVTTNLTGYLLPVTQSTSAHTGSSALQGTVLNFVGSGYPPFLWSTFPITPQRYANLTGWFKLSPVSGDSLYFLVELSMPSSGLGFGEKAFGGTVSSYTQFNVPLSYYGLQAPDTAYIYITLKGNGAHSDTPHVGSTFWLDDLAFTGTATGVEQQAGVPYTYALRQNFPNPFNPTTQIDYELAVAGRVSLKVFDILGREVARVVDADQAAGRHSIRFDAAGLASGMYIYRLQSGSFVDQRKMMILK